MVGQTSLFPPSITNCWKLWCASVSRKYSGHGWLASRGKRELRLPGPVDWWLGFHPQVKRNSHFEKSQKLSLTPDGCTVACHNYFRWCLFSNIVVWWPTVRWWCDYPSGFLYGLVCLYIHYVMFTCLKYFCKQKKSFCPGLCLIQTIKTACLLDQLIN